MTLQSGRGIHQILPSVSAALGVDGSRDELGLPEAKRYVVFVVDGLGELQLREHAELAPFLSSLPAIGQVRCGVPSTTSVSLTSLATGLRPGAHGMPGYTCRIPGTTTVLNTLSWDDSVDPRDWQPHRNALARAADAGIAVAVVNDARFESSGLTRCSMREVPFVGVSSSWERLDAICDHAESAQRSLVYGYESRLDHTGHGHGVDSQQWRDALSEVDQVLVELRRELDPDTVLLVTADHGMIDLGQQDRFDVQEHPELLEDVSVLAGEARLRYLYTRTGAENSVAERWREYWGDRVEVRLRSEAEDWFGPLDPSVRARFGDVIVAARDGVGLFDSGQFAIELKLKGFHGSTSEAERRIPVLVAV